jgi:hypothetical protein
MHPVGSYCTIYDDVGQQNIKSLWNIYIFCDCNMAGFARLRTQLTPQAWHIDCAIYCIVPWSNRKYIILQQLNTANWITVKSPLILLAQTLVLVSMPVHPRRTNNWTVNSGQFNGETFTRSVIPWFQTGRLSSGGKARRLVYASNHIHIWRHIELFTLHYSVTCYPSDG